MSLLTQIKLKATAAFDKIGNSNGTVQPQSDDNRFSIAWEYFIADLLSSRATKRKELAKKQAEEVGILGSEHSPNTTKLVFDNEHFSISAKTAKPAERLDKALLSAKLIQELGPEKATSIIKQCTIENKPATSFIFSEK